MDAVGVWSSVVNAIAVIALVGITAYYAAQTRATVHEMQQARAAQILPKLKLKMHFVGPLNPAPRVVNVGQGAATDVRLSLTTRMAGHEMVAQWEAQALSPGEHQDFFFGTEAESGLPSWSSLIEAGCTLRMHAQYADLAGCEHQVTEDLDVAAYLQALEHAKAIAPADAPGDIVRQLKKLSAASERIAKAAASLAETSS